MFASQLTGRQQGLFNHLVGNRQQHRGNFQAERRGEVS
jgi:hypothetical protein